MKTFQTRQIEAPKEATLWVGSDGNDSNEGAHEAPLASIQTAIDRLDEELGLFDPKLVRVKPGTYQENLVINTGNLHLQGMGGADFHADSAVVQIEDDDSSRPVLTVTNMTDAGYEAFESAGGASYSWSAPTSYSYTGADLDREFVSGEGSNPARFSADIVVEGLLLWHKNGGSTDVTNIQMLGAPDPNTSNKGYLEGVTLRNVQALSTASNTANAFCKNVVDLMLDGCQVQTSGEAVFDHADRLNVRSGVLGSEIQADYTVLTGDNSTSVTEGGLGHDPSLGSEGRIPFTAIDGPVALLGDVYLAGYPGPVHHVHANGDLVFATSRNIEGPWEIDSEAQFDGRSSGAVTLRKLRCDSGSYQGTGTMLVDRLDAHAGNFSISSGGPHTIKGGHVNGDMNISGGTTVELRGMTINGDLDVDGATTVTCKGCHIQGNVEQEDVAGGSLTIDGGSIMGSTPSAPSNASYTRNTGS